MTSYSGSDICRVCINDWTTELISLLDEENKSIVKKLRACADITIDLNDDLPKYLCNGCLQNLEFAYKFKIQCEYTDRKLRDIIAFEAIGQKTNRAPIEQTLQSIKIEHSTEVIDNVNGIKCDYLLSEVESLIEVDHEQASTEEMLSDVDEEADDTNDLSEDILYLNEAEENNEFPENDMETAEEMFEEEIEHTGWNFENSDNTMDEETLCTDNDTAEHLSEITRMGSDDDREQNELLNVKSDAMIRADATVSSTTANRVNRKGIRKTTAASKPVSVSKKTPSKSKKPFECDTCSATFLVYTEYNEHKKTHGKQRYQCLTCQRWFSKRYHLAGHQKTHKGLKPFECSDCSKCYTNQGNLDRHIRVFHRNERQYTCSICSKSFSQIFILRQHHAVHVTERTFSCEICEKKFKTEDHLKLHKTRHLPIGERPKRKYKPPKKKYKAPLKPCVCSECGKQSTTVALHQSHMKTHSGERPYECSYCNKRFSFHQSLKNHIYLHTGEKRFKCSICGMVFRQIGHLQGHKLVHTGIKQHSCPACGKQFALRGNLTVHMRIHSGETPYHCNVCPRKFYDSNGLKRHRLIHERRNEINSFDGSVTVKPNISVQERFDTMTPIDVAMIDNQLESGLPTNIIKLDSLYTPSLGDSGIATNKVNGARYEVTLPENRDGTMIYTIQ